MTQDAVGNEKGWYTRPLFSVSSMQEALEFYCAVLGFEQSWKHDENGRALVTQVNKGGFELILTETLESLGQARVYVALSTAGFRDLERVIAAHQISVQHIFWGYPLLQIKDPDGNELLISTEEDTCHAS